MAKKDYVQYINVLLRKNTEQSKQELLELFADKEFRKKGMLEDTRLGYMYIAICIYRAEKAAHIEENILMNVDSLGEICNLIYDMKFLLWRIEFQTESERGSGTDGKQNRRRKTVGDGSRVYYKYSMF